jgi:sugar/nucleoside kinase (ribokinase family)
LSNLKKEKIDTSLISIQKDKLSNYHYVLWFEDDRTILVKHHPYEYKLPKFDEPKAIYLSSLGDKTEKYHEEIAEYLEKHPSVKLIFQPGTFQIKLGTEKLNRIYKRTDFFAVNKREAQKILNTKENDFIKLLNALHQLGPKMVLVTDGIKGAYFSDGTKKMFMPIYPDKKPPYERTGAGDSYTTTLACSILPFNEQPEEGLKWAGINANSVIQYIGAQKGLLKKEKIEEILKDIPENYKAEII